MTNFIQEFKGTAKNWWLFILIGILFIIGAIWIFRTPVESFVGLASFFSALILLSGILSILFSFSNQHWGRYLIGGILNVIIGVILISHPEMTSILFATFIGFWILFGGFDIISIAIDFKRSGAGNWGMMLFFGILITLFGFMSIINPVLGAGYLVYMLAISIFFMGVANISLALEFKKVKKVIDKPI